MTGLLIRNCYLSNIYILNKKNFFFFFFFFFDLIYYYYNNNSPQITEFLLKNVNETGIYNIIINIKIFIIYNYLFFLFFIIKIKII